MVQRTSTDFSQTGKMKVPILQLTGKMQQPPALRQNFGIKARRNTHRLTAGQHDLNDCGCLRLGLVRQKLHRRVAVTVVFGVRFWTRV